MTSLWPVVYYLFPGMLLGFGFAVYPHRGALGRHLAPGDRRLWLALPGTALRVGWLLMAATLMTHLAGETTGAGGGEILLWCLTLDAMAAGAGLMLLAGGSPIRGRR